MKKISIFLICIVCYTCLSAQTEAEVSAYLFTSAGGFNYSDAQNTGATPYTMSWIIGEPINETFSGSKKQLTQGFLQAQPLAVPQDTVSNEKGAGEFTYQVKVYPNPSSGIIYLAAEAAQNEIFTLYVSDLQGHLLQRVEKRMLSDVLSLDISNYREGMYIIRIYAHSDKKSKLFRIIKTTRR